MTRAVPHDADAEKHLIGACLMSRHAIEAVAPIVNPADLIGVERRTTFAAILDLWGAGEPVDSHTVAARQGPGGLDGYGLLDCQSGVPSTKHAEKYARIIVEHAARRRIIALAGELVDAAYDGAEPSALMDRHRAALETVDLPAGKLPKDLMRLDDLLDAPVEDRAPWVVPGLLRRDWRVIVVAPEGAGKTQLLQQVAVCASQGVHPLTYESVPAIRVLMVDLENPEERIIHGCEPIRVQVRRRGGYDGDRLHLWHRPGGIDLRTRANVAELETVLEHVRPELLVMGPAYKASARQKGEGWDEGASAVQRVLDQLRTRFGFALLMEDHAPQSSNGVRDLRPFGSSLWLRWPEIGIKLAPERDEGPREAALKRWRGDRLPNGWPDRVKEGDQYPWVGVWENGMPRYSQEAA